LQTGDVPGAGLNVVTNNDCICYVVHPWGKLRGQIHNRGENPELLDSWMSDLDFWMSDLDFWLSGGPKSGCLDFLDLDVAVPGPRKNIWMWANIQKKHPDPEK
jgi:hypothetical protein